VQAVPPARAAALLPRLASLLYESLIVTALVLLAALAWQGVHGLLTGRLEAGDGLALWTLRGWLLAVLAAYFCGFWVRAGQTLPMRTWRLRIERADGGLPGPGAALARHALAWLSLLAAGAGFAWALIDRDRQFLHDRLAGTRIVRVPR